MRIEKQHKWVPTLYLSESLPFSAVMLVSVIMFKDMGLSDAEITLYTGWLGLPWVVKPVWSPIVDNIRTKRWWILATQTLMGVLLGLVAFTLPLTNYWLQSSLALFMIVAFASATHDISADGFYIIGLSNTAQELYVGVRNTFYRIGMVVGQGGIVMLVGYLQQGCIPIPPFSDPSSWIATFTFTPLETVHSWTVAFLLIAIAMLLLAAYHSVALPKVEQTKRNREELNIVYQAREFAQTLRVFIQRPHIVSALFFILLFRLPEGLLTKIVPLFLTRSHTEGGLELNTVDFGLIYGTLGVAGLLIGGIIGGWSVSKWGLRRCLWPLVLCITLPDAVYVYLSYASAPSIFFIGLCVCIEQIGYGLGFAAYTLFLVTFSRGERSTAVFSICTAGQYLGGVMLPGMLSGLISTSIGYRQFFLLVMALCLVTFAVTACVKIEGDNTQK